jgi:hypothetical protein
MPLTQPAKFDVNKAIAHLREKWAGNPCPMCHVSNWNVQDSIFQLPQFSPNTSQREERHLDEWVIILCRFRSNEISRLEIFMSEVP